MTPRDILSSESLEVAMKAILPITPIELTTRNGFTRARVTGIDMKSGDPFRGQIEHEPGDWRAARWRSNGQVRDGSPGWNLIMQQDEMKLLYAEAKRLNARLN